MTKLLSKVRKIKKSSKLELDNNHEFNIDLKTKNFEFGYNLDQLKNIEESFFQELHLSSLRKKTSLYYQLIELESVKAIPENQIFQVILLGGSHIESALVRVKNGQPKLLSFQEKEIGKLQTKQQVFELIEDFLDEKVKILSLNLAYPLKTVYRDKIIDGILLSSPKEHRLKGLVGETIGKSFENYLKSKSGRKVRVTVCNNNVSLAFAAGNLKNKTGLTDNTITGIVATGLNFGFFLNKQTFVNLESGNFNKFSSTISGKQIDRESLNPNQNLYEKEVGAAYLWKHFNYFAEQMGLKSRVSSTVEMLNFPHNSVESRLTEKILENSAALVAAQLAAIIRFKQGGNEANIFIEDLDAFKLKNSVNISIFAQNTEEKSKISHKKFSLKSKIKIVIEGSLFWETKNYKSVVETYLERLGVDTGNIEFIRINSGFIIGAAKLITKSAVVLTIKSKLIEKLVAIFRPYTWFSNSPPRLLKLFR